MAHGVQLQSSSLLRAVGYCRVSTDKQLERDLSVPDQQRQINQHCEKNGWRLVNHYIEGGLTATDDNRPEFQRMIERATDDDHPFDVIVVHSFSRFFRDLIGLELYIRRLAKSKVQVVSITQPLGSGPEHDMLRQMIGLFDEYTSKEISKHVRRGLKENARQGFWNGSRPPLGYRLEEAERRGERIKKRLAVDEIEAETVRLIFRLYRVGDGKSGPIGIKSIAKYLNAAGHRTRQGGYFGSSLIQVMLRNTTYKGEFLYNKRNYKTEEENPVEETVLVAVPVIIDPTEFGVVQALLSARNRLVTPPRIVTGPILLTGLTFCSKCGGAMTMSSGTSHTKKVYNFYSCLAFRKKGKLACDGCNVSMPALDKLVVGRLTERLFTKERIAEIIREIAQRRATKSTQADKRAAELRRRALDGEVRLNRLYRSIEEGIVELDDLLREKVAALQSDRRKAQDALDRLTEATIPAPEVSEG
ncbi:recombinase family protein [Rhizobium ruizarguesonis]|nr:recombinase family protein [Rhizobium ruizarguesonis]TBD27757.1 recombinase family protein [Rhizobium ruizarguesonis]